MESNVGELPVVILVLIYLLALKVHSIAFND